MIGSLTGTITTTNRNPLIIQIQGVGYLVTVAPKKLYLYTQNSITTLYIYSHIREDAFELYGFANQLEQDMFRLLVTVSGIGPKTAILIMNASVEEIHHAILEADVDFFTAIPRVGKKNAQKLIIELKSKLGSLTDINLQETESSNELMEGLISMGFSKQEIQRTTKYIDKTKPLEFQIKEALKNLGKHS